MPEENNEKIEEQEEPLKVPEPEPMVVKPIDHTKSSNIDDDLGNQFTKTQKDDLTDAGETTLHKHDDRYIYKENTTAFIPDADYEPATKKYVDDNTLKYFKAGDTLLAQTTYDTWTSSNTPVKAKEITIQAGGELRINFTAYSGGLGVAKTQVYRDGVAVGTEQNTNTEEHTNYSEDLSGWSSGDKLQIYIWNTSGSSYVKNVNIYYLDPRTASVDYDPDGAI